MRLLSGVVMNHDPLCHGGDPSWTECVTCDLINRVREDDLYRLKEIGLKVQDEHITNGTDWLYEPIKQFRRDVWIGFQREIAALGGEQ